MVPTQGMGGDRKGSGDWGFPYACVVVTAENQERGQRLT
jgi:hypothetical protein